MNIVLEKEEIKTAIDEVNDEHLLRAIKELLSYAQSTKERLPKPFTQQQIIERALASEKDIEAGRTTSLKKLREEIKSW